MKKFKIFFGNNSLDSKHADEQTNEWLEQNPDIDILLMKYQQARCGDHSICILYEERGKIVTMERYYDPFTQSTLYKCHECGYGMQLDGDVTYPIDDTYCPRCKKGKSS